MLFVYCCPIESDRISRTHRRRHVDASSCGKGKVAGCVNGGPCRLLTGQNKHTTPSCTRVGCCSNKLGPGLAPSSSLAQTRFRPAKTPSLFLFLTLSASSLHKHSTSASSIFNCPPHLLHVTVLQTLLLLHLPHPCRSKQPRNSTRLTLPQTLHSYLSSSTQHPPHLTSHLPSETLLTAFFPVLQVTLPSSNSTLYLATRP